MSVAAVFTSSVPAVNRDCTAVDGVVSDELSPQSVELMRLPGAGKVAMFTLQRG